MAARLLLASRRGVADRRVSALVESLRQDRLERSPRTDGGLRSEEHTSELQSRVDLVCRLLLEKKKRTYVRLGDDHGWRRAGVSSDGIGSARPEGCWTGRPWCSLGVTHIPD